MRVTLFMKDGTADKEYRVWIQKVEDKFVCRVAYGRRGGNLTFADKSGPVSQAQAEQSFERIVREKTAKGYAPGADDGTKLVVPAKHATPAEFIRPMLLSVAEMSAAGSFIGLADYCAQMKFDGVRCQIHMLGDEVNAYSRTGKPLALTQQVCQALQMIDDTYHLLVLDGELVDNQFHAFDVLAANVSIAHMPYRKRLKLLEKLIPVSSAVHRGLTAYTKYEKDALYKTLLKEGAEGAVFKHLDAPYEAGVRSERAFKVKFVSTASVLVDSVNTRRSVNMALADGTQVGSVTIPPNKVIPQAGSIIEVRYLYAHRDGCLIQPVFLHVRTDVAANGPEQLRYKNEKRSVA